MYEHAHTCCFILFSWLKEIYSLIWILSATKGWECLPKIQSMIKKMRKYLARAARCLYRLRMKQGDKCMYIESKAVGSIQLWLGSCWCIDKIVSERYLVVKKMMERESKWRKRRGKKMFIYRAYMEGDLFISSPFSRCDGRKWANSSKGSFLRCESCKMLE